MEEKNLDTWAEFEIALRELQTEYNVGGGQGKSALLFRGQSDASWPLTTTLERRPGSPRTFQEYARWVWSTLPQVQTLTDRDWPMNEGDVSHWGQEYDHNRRDPPGYDYYVYLRHHGFPSPLLDWSRSPYVAAFFALRTYSADRVAIYVFSEFSTEGKVTTPNQPQIRILGPDIRSHPRHVLQQCQYTTSSTFEENRGWKYTPHSGVFGKGSRGQDRLWKFIFPASERLVVLKQLDLYNLNAYSLFQTEDALLETVALRVLEFQQRGQS